MIFKIDLSDWVMQLPEAIRKANDGDTIIVASQNMLELANRAKSRLCPDKKILFQVDESNLF